MYLHKNILCSDRESEFERWYGECYVSQGVKHGYFRRLRWDNKFQELGCYIHGQKVSNLDLCQMEGQAFTLGRFPKLKMKNFRCIIFIFFSLIDLQNKNTKSKYTFINAIL